MVHYRNDFYCHLSFLFFSSVSVHLVALFPFSASIANMRNTYFTLMLASFYSSHGLQQLFKVLQKEEVFLCLLAQKNKNEYICIFSWIPLSKLCKTDLRYIVKIVVHTYSLERIIYCKKKKRLKRGWSKTFLDQRGISFIDERERGKKNQLCNLWSTWLRSVQSGSSSVPSVDILKTKTKKNIIKERERKILLYNVKKLSFKSMDLL